jgi:hypothetical protein
MEISDMFRLHYDLPKPVISPKDIACALECQKILNNNPKVWARFEAVQFDSERLVTVTWGFILSNDDKEKAIQTIAFTLLSNDQVYISYHSHL